MSEKTEEKITHVSCSFCHSFVKEATIIRTPKGIAFICERCKKREEEPKKCPKCRRKMMVEYDRFGVAYHSCVKCGYDEIALIERNRQRAALK